jgi:regulator of protease activity HflC (stomatin/prohibitin superfamily)
MNGTEELTSMIIWVVTIIVVLAVFMPQIIRILREYERGVIFRLGKLLRAKGPGLVLLIPFIDRMVKVDMRILTINVPKQEVITRDNVTINVDAIIFFRVVDAEAAIVKVERFLEATSLFGQTTLRSVLGQVELDELLAERDKINLKIQDILDIQTDPWGIKVTSVEIKDVVLPDTMKRAMARQAEMERERRAKVINAEGEFQAAEKLVLAGEMISKVPTALQIRFLQAMADMSGEHSTFLFMPIPMDMMDAFTNHKAKEKILE